MLGEKLFRGVKIAGKTFVAGAGSCLAVGLWYRPEPDLKDGYWVQSSDRAYDINHMGDGQWKLGWLWSEQVLSRTQHRLEQPMLDKGLVSPSDEAFTLWLSRTAWIGMFTLISKFCFNVGHKWEQVGDAQNFENYKNLVVNRKPGHALITVSNHMSNVDDPCVLSVGLPWSACDAKKARWSFCTQDLCYQNPFTAAFCNNGKVMPIKKGGSIDQPLWLHAFLRVVNGDWVHVFPEGKINNIKFGVGLYGDRSDKDIEKFGVLKWGAAKLIVHADNPVTVLPLFHKGMSRVTEQSPVTKVFSKLRLVGEKMSVMAGEPLDFSDLIEEHEKVHGKIRKLGKTTDLAQWQSTVDEKELYTKITMRIEDTLRKMENQIWNGNVVTDDRFDEFLKNRNLTRGREDYGRGERRVVKNVIGAA
eukprot:gene157-809_t